MSKVTSMALIPHHKGEKPVECDTKSAYGYGSGRMEQFLSKAKNCGHICHHVVTLRSGAAPDQPACHSSRQTGSGG